MSKTVQAAAIAAIALCCSGCPAMMLSGLAYQGYKATEKKPDTDKDKKAPTKQTSNPNQPPDTSIE
ncbi:MAG TPA: hypothetical protein VMU16_10170 [Candidatus Binataceae bacterium]|nr:hypothetical protein [Candidatus Binataceae bacterium]